MEAAIAGALIDIDDAKRYVKRKSGDHEDMVAVLLNHVTGLVDKHTGRRLKSRSYTSLLTVKESDSSQDLRMHEWPVTAVTAIREWKMASSGGTRAVDVTGYRILNKRRIWVPNGYFLRGYTYEVDMTAGYLAGTHDSDLMTLRAATLRWLQVLWKDFEDVTARGVSFSLSGHSVNLLNDAIPKDVELALSKYVRVM